MGRFTPEAPPSPLTWRQKLRAVVQAAEALAYLHSCKPQILHRDFKEANILLDGDLHAYLSDTGFAKAARPVAAAPCGATSVRLHRRRRRRVHSGIRGRGRADRQVLGIVRRLRRRPHAPRRADRLLGGRDHRGEDRAAHKADLEEIDAAALGESGAGWPAEAADAIRTAYLGLCNKSKRKRHAARRASACAARARRRARWRFRRRRRRRRAGGVASRRCRRRRRCRCRCAGCGAADDDPALSIQRNVSDAFDGFMRPRRRAENAVGKERCSRRSRPTASRRVRRPDQLVPQTDAHRRRPRREAPPPPRVAQRGDPPRDGAVGAGGPAPATARGGGEADRRDRSARRDMES